MLPRILTYSFRSLSTNESRPLLMCLCALIGFRRHSLSIPGIPWTDPEDQRASHAPAVYVHPQLATDTRHRAAECTHPPRLRCEIGRASRCRPRGASFRNSRTLIEATAPSGAFGGFRRSSSCQEDPPRVREFVVYRDAGHRLHCVPHACPCFVLFTYGPNALSSLSFICESLLRSEDIRSPLKTQKSELSRSSHEPKKYIVLFHIFSAGEEQEQDKTTSTTSEWVRMGIIVKPSRFPHLKQIYHQCFP